MHRVTLWATNKKITQKIIWKFNKGIRIPEDIYYLKGGSKRVLEEQKKP
jgi:hypothetical protein